MYHGTAAFPLLQDVAYQKTSPVDPVYNCIAWAVRDASKWWWPTLYDPRSYWPPGLPREETIASFVHAFATVGFEPCASAEPEPGFEKIALYVDDAGIPTHAARQHRSGWTSKLGEAHDIVHAELRDLEGGIYGSAAQFFRRATG